MKTSSEAPSSNNLTTTQVFAHIQGQVDGVTHDMRNRLASLSMSVYLLERQANDPALHVTVCKIKQQLEELNRMMSDLDHLNTMRP